MPTHLGLSEACVPRRSCRNKPPCAWGVAARGAPLFSPSHMESPSREEAARWLLCRMAPRQRLCFTLRSPGWLRSTAAPWGLPKILVQWKRKPYAKRWSRAVLGRVSRGTLQRALKIKSWSLETTLCVSAPHLRSSGGSSCRTDPPCPLLLVLRTCVSSRSESTTSLGFPVHRGLRLLPSSVWWDCDTEPLRTVTTWEFGALF